MTTAYSPQAFARIKTQMMLRCTGIAIPPALVTVYLLNLMVDVPAGHTGFLVGSFVLVLGIFAGVAPVFISDRILKTALSRFEHDKPGERLQRLLEFPQRLNLFSGSFGWSTGAAMFVAVMVWRFNLEPAFIPLALVIGATMSLVIGIPTGLIIQEILMPDVVEEFHKFPTVRLKGQPFFAVRNAWYVPSIFVVQISSLVLFAGTTAALLFRRETARIVAHMAEHLGSEAEASLTKELADAGARVIFPIGWVTVVLVLVFIYTGVLLARREREAAEAIRASLEGLRDGVPRLPEFISTDETGDVAAAVSVVSVDVGQLYDKLRAVAAGDLSVQLTGDSGLARAFRESQVALLALTEKMQLLSRGEAVSGGELSGDLGRAFERLADALSNTILQARTIAEGDLRREVDASGALGAALDRMTRNLRGMVGNMQESGGRMSESVVSLRATASQLSSAATEQVSALTETANTMTEMSQTSAVSADRAVELIKQGEAASDVVEEGRKGAASAIAAMKEIAQSLSKVSGASNVLAERVQRIDSIIETVGFLADQSSTLAINAGIEASRAGEAGRGFAAVAREMRSLASDSRKATTQIREILSELRQKTVQVDAQVNEGAKTVETGSDEVSRLSEVVEHLGVTIHEAVGLMRQVEGSARQHQAGVSQVSTALSSMQSASQQIRDGARHLTELSEAAMEMSSQLKATAGAYLLPDSDE